MNKRFVFVCFAIKSGLYLGPNHGIAFLVPILKKYSYEVSYLHICDEIPIEEFRKKILDLKPSIVGFTSTTNQFKYLEKYSNSLKEFSEILQIAGGPGVTLDPEWVLAQTAVKGACIGEGEIPLKNLLDNIKDGKDIHDTEGFYWNVNGLIKKNTTSQFVADLSTLDYPDYSIFERKTVVHNEALVILIARGCPNNCSYCCNRALSEVYPSPSRYFRMPSVRYSIDLLRQNIIKYPEARQVIFADDLLTADKRWFIEFAREYTKVIALPYTVQGRVEFINPEIVETLKNSGCVQLSIGVESGNEHLRNTLLNRRHSNQLIIEKSRMVKSAGINLFTFTMVGFPSEGVKEMWDTFKLIKTIAPNSGICSFFYPYKGTKLYKMCMENNLLISEHDLLERTNFNTRVAIRMTANQEKVRIFFKKLLSLYYLEQAISTRMKNRCSMVLRKIQRG